MSDNLTQCDADFVRDLVFRRAAIQLDQSKQYLLEMRLEQLARDRGFENISTLMSTARSAAPTLDTAIVEAITTHETSFFRDLHPFNMVRDHVLPTLIAARERTRSLTIWSAACSTGQEAYSLAMIVREHFPALAQWPVRIVATDISEKVVAKAREGHFSQMDLNRGLPAPMLVKYFDRDGVNWRAKPALRDLIEFRKLNLLDPWGPLRPDLVLIRNVLIYFDVASKRSILSRIRQVIAPDGALLLGASETTFGIDEAWECVTREKSSYYRVRS
ncbi:MAG: protein-glutamate O-methyltransferase CheR [Polyangiales bacterium]